MNNDIVIASYPKSGNTFLARLLGDALNAPVTGIANAVPLATEGLDRVSPYTVRQLHLKPVNIPGATNAIHDGWQFALNAWSTERVIHIIRDPRDVAVSAYHYWERPTVLDTIECMVEGRRPLQAVGPWSTFVENWLSIDYNPNFQVMFYEHLINDTMTVLSRLFSALAIEPVNDLAQVIARQSIDAKRAQIERDGDTRPYGKSIQLHNLRKGVSGDWRNHFNRECADLAYTHWQRYLIAFHYEKDDAWRTSI